MIKKKTNDTVLSMIEVIEKQLQIGEVIHYHSAREIWDIYFYNNAPFPEGQGTYDTDLLESLDGFALGDQLHFAYWEVFARRCSACYSEGPLYDEDEEEYYCPVCET